MADDKDPFAKYLAPPAAEAADPFAKYLSTPVVQLGEPVTDPFSGVQTPGPPTQPTTTEDVAALKKGMYGNDASGAVLAGASHFLGDIPIVGPTLDAATDRAAAGLSSLVLGRPYGNNPTISSTISGDAPQGELARLQSNKKEAETAHPTAATIGGVAGNVAAALPIAALAPAALGLSPELGVAANALRAGATGGAVMGTDAAIKDTIAGKDFPTTAKDVVEQGGIGAATMAATPVVGKAVGALVGALSDKAAKIIGPLSGEDQRALDWAVTSLQRDRLMSDADIDKQFQELGPHAFLAEYGPNMAGAANSVNALPGEGKTIVADAISDRAAGQRQRIESAVTEAMGPRVNINNLTEQGIADRSDASRDLFEQFKSTKVFPTQPVKDLIAGSGEGMSRVPGLEELGLVSEAQHMAQLEAAATGKSMAPMQNFFTGGDRKDWPTTQSFQYIKQAIDKRIDGSYNDLGQPTQLTRFYTQMKKRLDDTIAKANPEAADVWMQAREAWGNPTEIMRARNEGQKAFQRGTRRDDMLTELIDYPQPARNAYKEGARDAIAEDMDATLNGDTQARNRLLAPANQEKLNYLATNKNYDSKTLIQKLEQEKAMGDFGNFVKGNSKTAATQAAQQMMTPDPSQTLIARGRSAYSPHVTPAAYVPFGKMAEEAAARAQGQSFENSRAAMAPWLMKQGPEAAAFAKALLAHQAATTPSQQISPATAQYIQMLARGAVPQAAQSGQQYLPQ